MTASADQESSLDLNQRQQTSDNQESQTIDSSTQTTAKIIERYTLTHMPTCVHFTEPNSQKQRTIPRIHVPMCDCLLKVMLGYDMSERDEERVQAFEDCCVTVSVIDQNKAVSMPLKDLRKLLDTQEWTRIQRANEEGTEKSNTNGVRDGRLETGTRGAQTFGQTPISRSISDRQPGPTDTAKCSTAEPHIRDQLEVMEISDEKSDNALVRHSSQHKRSEDGGAIGKVVKEGGTIGKLDTRTQDFLPGPTCSSAQGLESFPMGTLSQCLTCQRNLNTTAELTEHFSGPCGTHGCAKSTEPPLHRKELHEDTIAPVSFPVIADETKVFFCDVCGKKFARKADLIRHTRSHSGERPYPCEFPGCGQQFIDTTKLRVHERIRHSVLTSAQAEPEKLGGPSAASDMYRNCPCCSTTRDLTPGLPKLHLSIHRVHEGLACRFCGKKFDKSGELLRHVTIHTGAEKPFTCQFCPARLSDITNLKNHVLLWHKHEVIPERECDGLEIPKDVTKSDKELPIIETLNSAISDREMISVGTDDGQGVSRASSSRAENEVVAAHSISAALTATSTNQIVALSSLGPCRVSSSRTVSVLDESFIQVLGKVGLALFKNTTDTSHTASTLKTPAMLQNVDDSSYAQCVTQRKQAPGRSSIQELGSVPDQTQAIVAQHGRPCTVTKPRKADATQVEEIVTLPGQSSAIPGQGFVTQIEEILNQVQKIVTQREQSNVSQQKQSSLKHVVQTVDSWKARKPMSSGQMVATPLEEVTSASQLKRQGADVAQPEPIVAPYSPAYIGQLDQVMDQAQELQRQEKLNLRSVDTGSVDAADCLEKSAERESPKPEESLQHRAILWKQASASHASVIVPSGITPTHSFKNLSSAATSVAPIQLSGRDGNTVLAEESPQHHMHYATLPHAKHVFGTCTATHPVHMTVTSSRVPPIFPNYALPPAGHAAALTSGSTESVFMYERLPTGAVRYLPPPLKPLRYLLPKGHSYPSLSTVSGSMQPEVPDLHLKSTQTSRLCFCGAPGYMPTTQSFPAYFTQQHSQGLDSLSGGAQPQPPLVNLPTGIQSQGTILSPSVPQQHLPSGPLLAQRHSQRTVSFPTGIMSTFVLTGTEAQGKILHGPHQPFTSGPLLAGTQTQVSTLHLSQPKQQIMVGPPLAGLQNQGPNELQQRPHAGLLLAGTQAQGSTLHLSQPKQQFTSGLQNQESNELQQQPHAGPLLAGTQAPRTMITLTEHEQRPTSGPVIGTTRVQGNKIRPTSGTVVTARQLQETTTRPSILHRTPKVVHARGSFCGHPDSRDRGSKHLHSCPRNKPSVCFPIGAHHQMGVCRSTRTPVHRHDITSHYSSPHARSLVRLPTQTSHPAACHTPTDLRRRQLNGRAAHSAVHPPWSKQTHDPITCTSAKGLRHENSLNGRDRPEFQDTKCSLVTSQAYAPGTSLASWSASPSLNPRLDLATETCQSSRQLPCDVTRDRHVDITCVKRECEQDFHAQHVLISALKNGKTSRKRKASGKAGNFQKRVRFAL